MKLAPFETTWAEASMNAMFPGSPGSSAGEGLPGIGAMGLRDFLAEVLRYLPLRAGLGMRVAIWLVALAPFFVLGKLTTIARLPAADRERVVGALVASRVYVLRSLVLILKTMGALLYGGDPVLRARLMAPPVPTSGVRPAATLAEAPEVVAASA